MKEPIIKQVKCNKDKGKTYAELMDLYNDAISNGYLGEAELIVYAFIEDRLKALLSYLELTDVDRLTLNEKARSVYKGKKTDLRDLSTKLDLVSDLITACRKENEDNEYIVYIRKVFSYSVDIGNLNEIIRRIRTWGRYRNEIVHGIFNKDLAALRAGYKEHVEEGYKLARLVDKYVRRIKSV